MSYYDTMDEDLKRAKEILTRGSAANEELADLVSDLKMRDKLLKLTGGTIYGADLYAAYKLLESFVAEIERLRAALTDLSTIPALRFDQAAVRILSRALDPETYP